MTPRERITRVLDRQPVDRVAVDLWHTPEIVEQLQQHTGAPDERSMWKALRLDKIAWCFVGYDGATGSQVGAGAGGLRSAWGAPLVVQRAGEATYAEVASAPMDDTYDSPGDIERYPFFPDPDGFTCDAAATKVAAAHRDGFAAIGPWVSLFEIYCQLRGLEQAMMDLAESPALVDAVLDRVEEIQTRMMRRFFQRCDALGERPELTFISDDIGGQNGLLLSPAAWRRHLRPRLERWCRLVHDAGVRVFYHSDGGFKPVLDELLACGIDVLNPIQHVCPGMDLEHLQRRFGERVIFHGGVDNQFALPRGTVADVRAETEACLRTLGARGGFICCSCHNVQPGTPTENILEMIRTAQAWSTAGR
jgi:uroporphyrinogen decarboxylase